MNFGVESKEEDQYKQVIQKFWGKLAEMIFGPEHEQVFFKKMIHRLNLLKIKEKMV